MAKNQMPLIKNPYLCNPVQYKIVDGNIWKEATKRQNAADWQWHLELQAEDNKVNATNIETAFKLGKAEGTLELLDVLEEVCIEHKHLEIEELKDAGYPQFKRHECPECMAELRKELK